MWLAGLEVLASIPETGRGFLFAIGEMPDSKQLLRAGTSRSLSMPQEGEHLSRPEKAPKRHEAAF